MILQSPTDDKEWATETQLETEYWPSEEDPSTQRTNELLVALNNMFDTSQKR